MPKPTYRANTDEGDDCDHDVLDRPGQANPVCRKCGEANPDGYDSDS